MIDLQKVLFFFFLIFSTILVGQTTIVGKVVDQESSAIDGANVLLKDSASNTVAFSSTDADGSFVLKALPGKYQIRITHLGFSSKSEEITVALEKLDLKTIIIYQDSSELEEVF